MYSVKDVFSLEDKSAIVTGASKGIGKEISRLLAHNGVNLALVARNKKELSLLEEELREHDIKVKSYIFDLTNFRNIPKLLDDIIAYLGTVDILINNAGVNLAKPIEEVNFDDWDKQIDVNLKSIYFLTKYTGVIMKEKKQGKIINISSQMSKVGYYDRSVYATTKGGLTQMTKSFAIEWAKFGINVNAVGPTFIETELTKNMLSDSAFRKDVLERIPLGHLAKTEDLFGTILLLSSSGSNMITGQTILVDGGWTVW